MTAQLTIRDYAIEQMNQLLTKLAFEMHRAAKTLGPDEIHDLRVSIRRFSQGLILFGDFFPEWQVVIVRMRLRLKRMMNLTSEIRNRDIALEHIATMQHSDLRGHLERERKVLEREFADMARRWSARDFSAKWRVGLSLQRA